MAPVPSVTRQLAGRLLNTRTDLSSTLVCAVRDPCEKSSFLGVKRNHGLVLLLVIDNPDPIDPLLLRR